MKIKKEFTKEEIEKILNANIETSLYNEKLYKLVMKYEEELTKKIKYQNYFIIALIISNILLWIFQQCFWILKLEI